MPDRKTQRRIRRRGNVALEFTLVGIPVLFILISVVNISYTMMTLHTMQEAVVQGARFIIGRGAGCAANSNTCTITIGTITDAMRLFNAGVDPNSLRVTFTTASGATTACNPIISCHGNSTVWPPASNSDNVPGKDIIVSADYPCVTVIAMFWPGNGMNKFGQMTLHAYSRQRMTF
jgi:Flp pilus assembly protein TadG